ncbi:rhomboid family intramembrane serine protease [Sporofaciens sp. SGI.106]|uniref:rhomboid family intramembrane serine protease n=1 Tax=Sporofaciens sp. SGI.106 TaxID=3420568 RepID=UPI003D013676
MQKVKISFNAPVTLGFVLICFVATVLGIITHGDSTSLLFMTYHSSLKDPLTYIRFLTHVFGHDGWNHFTGNVTYLLLLGPLLEEKYGSLRLIKVIVVTAIITGGINYIFLPNTALYGASGVVFAFIVLSSFAGFKEGEIPLTFILVGIVFVGQQVCAGITKEDDISQMTHIIGGIIGAIIGYQFNKNKM